MMTPVSSPKAMGEKGKDFCGAHGSSVHTMESILCPTVRKACSPVYAPICPGPALILSVSASVRLGPRSRRSIVIGISCSLLPYSFSQAITSQKCVEQYTMGVGHALQNITQPAPFTHHHHQSSLPGATPSFMSSSLQSNHPITQPATWPSIHPSIQAFT